MPKDFLRGKGHTEGYDEICIQRIWIIYSHISRQIAYVEADTILTEAHPDTSRESPYSRDYIGVLLTAISAGTLI